ncbi:conjugated polyketone reductase C2 [Hanseniaspora valbyensis NRRL Y-1626]|uniref:Conjugated polyketone reductase C2 n=1 Tax=Hanseniaspora valbyensis NRRL Y-1626 TaxID=766949 RepID=A0A1B7SAG1_9ASCO|nr:conjugated polyketone reductase C2 [Hanseniaspora valbyensis NRRL Y-1626]
MSKSLSISKFQNNILDKNGNLIKIGFGVGSYWRIYKTENNIKFVPELVAQIKQAIESGFKMIDAAEAYNTYEEIGIALKELNIKREDIWITDKYINFSYKLRNSKGPIDSITRSLELMQLDYVDMYLLHTPDITVEKAGITLVEAWKQCEQLVEMGKVKQIGVSNFRKSDLEEIMKICKIKPMCNQVEFHPYLQQQSPGLREYCFENGIQLEAFSPLTPITKIKEGESNPVMPILKRLGEKYGKNEPQILLRWCVELGIIPLTTTSNKQRIDDYLNIFDFELTKEEVQEIINVKDEKFFRGWLHEYYPFSEEECNAGL